MPETRHGIPPEFLDAADEFVQLANRMTDSHAREWVAATMMYALTITMPPMISSHLTTHCTSSE